jgi:hypothetical protein
MIRPTCYLSADPSRAVCPSRASSMTVDAPQSVASRVTLYYGWSLRPEADRSLTPIPSAPVLIPRVRGDHVFENRSINVLHRSGSRGRAASSTRRFSLSFFIATHRSHDAPQARYSFRSLANVVPTYSTELTSPSPAPLTFARPSQS